MARRTEPRPLKCRAVDRSRVNRRPHRGAAERAVAHVRALITSGAVAPGQRLPAERTLATTIGVARPTVRAALRTLSGAGFIRCVRGVGSFAADAVPEQSRPARIPSHLLAIGGSALEEMRRLVEG